MRTIDLLLDYDITPAVFTTDFALALAEKADLRGQAAKYHLAVDSGMNRIGVFYLDVVDFIHTVNFHRALVLEGTFTHFATADDPSDWEFRKQLARFNKALELMRNARINPGIVHAANSAAISRYPEAYFDMVRQGISLYGISPAPDVALDDDFHPVMRVVAQVSCVKEPQLGEGVSYGLNYRVGRPVQIATVPIGYADGLRRELQGRMKVIINGRLCNQVGNICMDQMMIEVPFGHSLYGEGGPVHEGDEVVIMGRQGDYEITATTMAQELRTLEHEITCSFALRLPRIYVGGQA